MKTPGNPRPYVCTAVRAGHRANAPNAAESHATPPTETRLPPDCWPKLNSPGKLSSNVARPLIQLRSPPNLNVCEPCVIVKLSRIWCRVSTRLTGENGFDPIKPVPAI